jgi:hypothetical protein
MSGSSFLKFSLRPAYRPWESPKLFLIFGEFPLVVPCPFGSWESDNKKCANDLGGETAPLISKKPNHLPGALCSSRRFPSPVRGDSVLFEGNFVLRNGIFKKKKRAFGCYSRGGDASQEPWGRFIGFAEEKKSIITIQPESAHLCFLKGNGIRKDHGIFLDRTQKGI